MIPKNRTAIISGVTGQDGSYLSDLLIGMGYTVVGLIRRSSLDSKDRLSRISHIIGHPQFIVECADVTDFSSLARVILKYKPDEFYNLAAQSYVHDSFYCPTSTFEINAIGPLNILEAVRQFSPNTKVYQASTSEMFGRSYSYEVNGNIVHSNTDILPVEELPSKPFQYEGTPFQPQSPYSVAKAAAHYSVQLYRRSYGLFACAGILFNHESPRRGDIFVTRKITKWIGEYIRSGSSIEFPKLRLGNIDSYRDWGHAKDYVYAMYLMLQRESPEDYVVSTMETHTVREFLEEAFGAFNLNYKDHFVQDPKFMRPAEVSYLLGDSTKFRNDTGWKPKYSFKDLVREMVLSDAP